MRQNPLVVNMISAVWALAVGLNGMQQEFCGQNEPGICDAWLQAPNWRQQLFNKIKDSAFSRPDAQHETFSFTKNGYGNIPLSIWNSAPNGTANEIFYREVAVYSNEKLNLYEQPQGVVNGQVAPLASQPSNCVDPVFCPECKFHGTRVITKEIEKTVYVTQETPAPPPAPTFATSPAVPTIGGYSLQNATYDDQFIFIPSPDGVIIPLVMPIHREGKNCDK